MQFKQGYNYFFIFLGRQGNDRYILYKSGL